MQWIILHKTIQPSKDIHVEIYVESQMACFQQRNHQGVCARFSLDQVVGICMTLDSQAESIYCVGSDLNWTTIWNVEHTCMNPAEKRSRNSCLWQKINLHFILQKIELEALWRGVISKQNIFPRYMGFVAVRWELLRNFKMFYLNSWFGDDIACREYPYSWD